MKRWQAVAVSLRALRDEYGWKIIAPRVTGRTTVVRCRVWDELLPAIVQQLDAAEVEKLVGPRGTLRLHFGMHADALGVKQPKTYASGVAFCSTSDKVFLTNGAMSKVAPIMLMAGDVPAPARRAALMLSLSKYEGRDGRGAEITCPSRKTPPC